MADVANVLSHALGRMDPNLASSYLMETQHGNASTARVMAALALLALESRWLRRPILDYLLYMPAAVLLVASVSWTGHAAGTDSVLPVAADAVHVLAVAIWVGGVFYLAVVPSGSGPAQTYWLHDAMTRLAQVALISVILVVVTGTYGAYLHIWGLRALFGTPYGEALLIKLGLVAGVLALAAVNRWWFLPRILTAMGPKCVAWTLRAEALVMAAVLVAAAVLVNRIPPATPAILAHETPFEAVLDRHTVSGRFLPHERGYEVRLAIKGPNAGSAAVPETIRLAVAMPDHGMTPSRVTLERRDGGGFHAHGLFPMPGAWEAEFHVFGQTFTVEMLAVDQ